MRLHQIIPAAIASGLLAACSQRMANSSVTDTSTSAMAMNEAKPVMVGSQPMYVGKDIVDNAVHSAGHTTLVAAVKAAGLVPTLKGPGPFTVFAPTNEAFDALPAGTVPTLLKPENKNMLTKVLTYHVVPGRLDFDSMSKMIAAGGGMATLTTVEGAPLTLMMNGPHNIAIKDAKGGIAHITTYDVTHSNGDIQVIDKVLLPG
jgi:uncharacterized surface protein with fasciclin (FAS1) repeats